MERAGQRKKERLLNGQEAPHDLPQRMLPKFDPIIRTTSSFLGKKAFPNNRSMNLDKGYQI
eukprot:PDM63178.1 hypothetical protein PRIPAC_50393 [Pristionchus pacificus]